MSRIFRTLDDIPWPFRLFDERIIIVPRGANLITRNQDFKLIAFHEGRFQLQIENEASYDVKPGDFVLIPRPCVQNYYPRNASSESRLHVSRVIFDPTLASGAKQHATHVHSRLVSELLKVFPAVRYFPGGLKSEAGRLLTKISDEIESEEPGFREASHALLVQLAVQLLRLSSASELTSSGDGPGRADQIVSQARAWLLDHFDRPLKLSDAAWHLRISEEHLARVFNSRTGTTFHDHVRQLRITKARNLLLGSNESLSNIARACGFRSLAVFSVNFKALTGLGPGAYRRLHSPKIVINKTTLEWEDSVP